MPKVKDRVRILFLPPSFTVPCLIDLYCRIGPSFRVLSSGLIVIRGKIHFYEIESVGRDV